MTGISKLVNVETNRTKLYLVTCSEDSSYAISNSTVNVYTIATNETEASETALRQCKDLGWSKFEYVSNVKLLASMNNVPILLAFADNQ